MPEDTLSVPPVFQSGSKTGHKLLQAGRIAASWCWDWPPCCG